MQKKDRKCVCGNDRFDASQRCYHDVVVDSQNIFIEDKGVFEAETPYGAYTCTVCGAEYEELEMLDKITEVAG